MYELKELPPAETPMIPSNFVTREEFESVINQLRQVMMAPPQPEPVQEKPALNLNF
ncbi:MAG: hypothetical protein IKB70_07360 [Bacilli bacterium]|nr:hypothetical protein [Bacilli bacterium]